MEKKKKKTFFRTIPARAAQGIAAAAMTVALMMPAPVLAEFVPVEETPSSEETNFVEVTGRQEESKQSFSVGSGQTADLRTILKPMSSITESEVRNKLTTYTSYWPGKTWDERYRNVGKECYAFAHYVFNNIFGRSAIAIGQGSTTYKYKFETLKSDIHAVGILPPGSSQTEFDNLLRQAAPGDFIQVKRRVSGGQHSAIVVNVNSSAGVITYLDANGGSQYNLCALREDSFTKFRKSNTGLSIYRYNGYSPNGDLHDPTCALDGVEVINRQVRVSGWAFDVDDLTKDVPIHVYISNGDRNEGAWTTVANTQRHDIDAAYHHGIYRGFDFTIPTEIRGQAKVSVWALNTDNGQPYLIGERDVNIVTRNPVCALDGVLGGTGTVRVFGWAFDEDDLTQDVPIHFYINDGTRNEGAWTTVANSQRHDIDECYHHGTHRGYDWTVPTGLTGNVTVTVYAINVDDGSPYKIGEKSVTVNPDTIKPVVNNVVLLESDSEKLVYQYDVSDNTGFLKELKIAKWSEKNGKDDLVWETQNHHRLGTRTFTIQRSEHNGEYGSYCAEIYATDCVGNQTVYTLGDQIEHSILAETSALELSIPSNVIRPGDSITVGIKKTPVESVLRETQWSSDNPSVATVEAGVITAVAPGTANITLTAKNGVSATCRVTVESDKVNLSTCRIASIAEQTYTGSPIRPSVTITASDGTVLQEGTDYTVSYSSNRNPGTAQVTVTGKGNYTGTASAKFTIVNPTVEADSVLSVPSVHATAGQTVRIPVSIDQNSGMAGLAVQFDYDSSILENPRLENTQWDGYWNSSTASGIKAIWLGTANNTSTGHVFDLVFDVKDTAVPGTYAITGTVDQDNTFNDQQQDVHLGINAGSVVVAQYLLGDVNSDGKVNNRDALMISQYVAGKITFSSSQMLAADFNGDGKVNNRDGFAIFQSVAQGR